MVCCYRAIKRPGVCLLPARPARLSPMPEDFVHYFESILVSVFDFIHAWE